MQHSTENRLVRSHNFPRQSRSSSSDGAGGNILQVSSSILLGIDSLLRWQGEILHTNIAGIVNISAAFPSPGNSAVIIRLRPFLDEGLLPDSTVPSSRQNESTVRNALFEGCSDATSRSGRLSSSKNTRTTFITGTCAGQQPQRQIIGIGRD